MMIQVGAGSGAISANQVLILLSLIGVTIVVLVAVFIVALLAVQHLQMKPKTVVANEFNLNHNDDASRFVENSRSLQRVRPLLNSTQASEKSLPQ